MSVDSYESQCAAAIRHVVGLLDQDDSAWRSVIDTQLLDMSDPALCVLGQVYGYWDVGLARLGIPPSSLAATVCACRRFRPNWLAEIRTRRRE